MAIGPSNQSKTRRITWSSKSGLVPGEDALQHFAENQPGNTIELARQQHLPQHPVYLIRLGCHIFEE